jgi:methylase of polypeptide subunit release factors
MEEGPLVLERPADAARFRAVLDAAGYTAENIREALGLEASRRVRRSELPVYRRRLEGTTQLASLIRLLWLGDPVEPAEAERALAPLGLETAAALALVEASAEGTRARVRLVPFDPLVLACDRDDADAPDFVAGIHPPSVTLANLTVRRPVGAAADVAAGCGVQALLAAGHSDRVVATDVNPRALRFLAFNAQLNGAANVECRLGNLFEPVEGERFELVTCNPPYVVSPETRYLYRDSGLEGDAISRETVRRVPAHLAEGGFAHVLVSWIRRPGEDWQAPLTRWVEGSGCDAWLLHSASEDPLTAAATWNSPLRVEKPDEYERALDRWLAYYERLEADSVAYGAVILRRRAGGRNWVRADDVLASPVGPSSDLILRVFENQDYLEALPEEDALLSGTFRLVERHRVEQVVRLRSGRYEVETTLLVLEDGLEFRGPVDGVVVDVLAGCNGRRPLQELVDEAARGHDLSPAGAREELVPVVRRLLELGILDRAR